MLYLNNDVNFQILLIDIPINSKIILLKIVKINLENVLSVRTPLVITNNNKCQIT